MEIESLLGAHDQAGSFIEGPPEDLVSIGQTLAHYRAETAIRELRLAQQLDPNIGHLGLADLCHHIGLEKEAIDEFERALKVDPNDDPIKDYYVGHYLRSARPDEGLGRTKDFSIADPTSGITWKREW